MLCRAAAVKISPYIIIVQVIFYFLWGHWTHPSSFENRIPYKPALGGGEGGGGGGSVCSLANFSVAYEETQSNQVSDFCDFMCSLFPKTILFYFYLRFTLFTFLVFFFFCFFFFFFFLFFLSVSHLNYRTKHTDRYSFIETCYLKTWEKFVW